MKCSGLWLVVHLQFEFTPPCPNIGASSGHQSNKSQKPTCPLSEPRPVIIEPQLSVPLPPGKGIAISKLRRRAAHIAEGIIAVTRDDVFGVVGDGDDAPQPVGMVVVALSAFYLRQRLVDAGTVDILGDGRGDAVIDQLQNNILSVINVAGRSGRRGVNHLFFNPPTEGVVLKVQGPQGDAGFDQLRLGQLIFSVPGELPVIGMTGVEITMGLVAANIIGVVEFASLGHTVGSVVAVGGVENLLDRGTGAAIADRIVDEVLFARPGRGLGELVGSVVGIGGGCGIFTAGQAVADFVVLWIGDAKAKVLVERQGSALVERQGSALDSGHFLAQSRHHLRPPYPLPSVPPTDDRPYPPPRDTKGTGTLREPVPKQKKPASGSENSLT